MERSNQRFLEFLDQLSDVQVGSLGEIEYGVGAVESIREKRSATLAKWV
ncbi:hypothetical protein [Pseudarthrobacter sp. B4EP4b]|nr:hypothetical protein [Pseudarthrobacter sp. B4EP4b]